MQVAPALGLIALVAAFSGCGGGNEAVTKPNALAQHVVAVSEIPTLFVCLTQLATALQKNPNTREIALDCANGTYQGLTTTGRECSLRVDALTQEFQFKVERDAVNIKWEDVAYASDGSRLHNLQSASAPVQPGIQLSRFTPGLAPITEALILSMRTGKPVLPNMIYQRTADGATKSVLCNFGA